MSNERLNPDRLGFTSEVNFHSTRRSFATLMENSLVADVIGQQRYLGHAISTQMHGIYSGGSGIEKLKNVVAELRYAEGLEVALKLALPATATDAKHQNVP
jgi:integrase